MRSIVLALLLLTFRLADSVQAQYSLVTNGGFENGTNNWTLVASGGSSVGFSVVNTSPKEGSSCLQAEITVLGSDPWSIQIKNAFGPVVEGHLYRATIWTKSANAGSTINYTIGKATANYDEYAATYGLALKTEWTQYTHEFTAEVSTSDDITLALHITGTDTYWFDDFSVKEVADEINSATINTTGNRVLLDFNLNLTPPENNEQAPFFVYSAENEYNVSQVVPQAQSDKLMLYLDERALAGEEITVEYIPGSLRSSAGVEIQGFTIEAINNSTYSEPVDVLITEIADSPKVYPNPSSDYISINIHPDLQLKVISLFDIAGALKFSIEPISGKDQYLLELDDLNPGVYLIRFVDIQGNSYYNRIIKK